MARGGQARARSQNQRAPAPGRVQFHFLAEHYLKADFGRMLYARNRLTPSSSLSMTCATISLRVSANEIAEDIKPLEIQRWLKSLNENNGLAWTTIAKMRGIMHRIYKIGILHEHVAKNPVLHVETRSKTNYRAIVITPAQTLAILKVPPLASSFHVGAHLCGDGAPRSRRF